MYYAQPTVREYAVYCACMGLMFSLQHRPTANSAEHVAPWVHTVRKWVMVSGLLHLLARTGHSDACQPDTMANKHLNIICY